MRVALYNIAYGTGNPGGRFGQIMASGRYLAAPRRPFRKISRFLDVLGADVVCLVEADLGSVRTGRVNHVEELSERLAMNCVYLAKYSPSSPLLRLPYMKYQGNAVLAHCPDMRVDVDFFPRGTKKLIMMVDVNGVLLVVVHLALTRKIRKIQLDYLAHVLPVDRPLIVAGDFNTFAGAVELGDFLARTGLRSSNLAHHPTYPAWRPLRELDYVLHTADLEVCGFDIPRLRFSDHLPLVVDFELRK